ncbi:MAG: glycosyltransferase family 2 protein [Egibacteraceae bacterium]
MRATLTALAGQSPPPMRTIVVDNHSGDGSADRIKTEFPEVDTIELPQNAGYGAGMNAGIDRCREAGMDLILLLTHECRLGSGALAALVGHLTESPGVGAAGPLLGYLTDECRVYSAGGLLHPRSWNTRHVDVPVRVDDWRGAPPRAVDYVDGAALLVREEAARGVGGFDEQYFLYFEETEFLLRMRALGWTVECVPAALAWQQPGDFGPYFRVRNRLRFLARNAPGPVLVREFLRVVARMIRVWAQPWSAHHRRYAREGTRGLLDFLRRRWGPR